MLTAKENFRACLRGKGERFVNQYEAIALCFDPFTLASPFLQPGERGVTPWGVLQEFPVGTPGSFPIHTPETIVVKDIEHWRDYVKVPSLDFPEELWQVSEQMLQAVDADKAFRAVMIAPGLFEMVHHLCSINEALPYYITNPTELHELIDCLADHELRRAEQICDRLHPEMIFHHDDWGTERNSFLSPQMFADFFCEPYKKIYGYYHDHGVELIVHHSDSFAANLVPTMIEMGIDVWQGCMYSNNIPDLIAKYGGQISFMGGIDNKFVDFDGWTQADCDRAARKLIAECGKDYFLPCITQGGPGSNYPGTYKGLADAIDAYNAETFGFTVAQLEQARRPMDILF